jgi:hypothetical protein
MVHVGAGAPLCGASLRHPSVRSELAEDYGRGGCVKWATSARCVTSGDRQQDALVHCISDPLPVNDTAGTLARLAAHAGYAVLS